ncbi:unnamed protein product [Ectocarpus sp. CCAP 1310/34]|nr:unnamed protein product [Ectocarpus sp. CCAP 1310/34]
MTSVYKPDLSGLPTFNVAGGRPDGRFGTRGSFTLGVRIMSGGHARGVPREAEVDHGNVRRAQAGPLRRGPHLRHPPHGAPRNPGPLHAGRTSLGRISPPWPTAIRPTERLGSRGRFTSGIRGWAGGKPPDVTLPRVRDPGTVLFESASERSRPSLSFSGETNVSGGKEDEARGGPLQVQAAFTSEVELLWREGGQREHKYRRCGPSHYVTGVSIPFGDMPAS